VSIHLGYGLSDADRSFNEIDVLDLQGGELTPSKTGVGSGEDQ
jgi:hypothetical protein